jgi:hypothetical protein
MFLFHLSNARLQDGAFAQQPLATAHPPRKGTFISSSTAAAGDKSLQPSSPSQSSTHDKQMPGAGEDNNAEVNQLMPTEFFEQGPAGVLQQVYDFVAQQPGAAVTPSPPQQRPRKCSALGARPQRAAGEAYAPHLQLVNLYEAGADDYDKSDHMQYDSTPGGASVTVRRKTPHGGNETDSSGEGGEGVLPSAVAASGQKGHKRLRAGSSMQPLQQPYQLAAAAAEAKQAAPKGNTGWKQSVGRDGKPKFKGVRQRPWGKWACEIREPGPGNNRVWLGELVTQPRPQVV